MTENWVEKRKYIRHPSDIPIEISTLQSPPEGAKVLNNISFGGLCFKSDIPYENGSSVSVRITHVRPIFEARGTVVWFRGGKGGEAYEVGVEFSGEVDAFRSRMVEQVCRIEQYKKEILEKEGRDLTGTQAALEWIKKYAEGFPRGK